MNIAADLCVYTNHEHMVEVLDSVVKDKSKWLAMNNRSQSRQFEYLAELFPIYLGLSLLNKSIILLQNGPI